MVTIGYNFCSWKNRRILKIETLIGLVDSNTLLCGICVVYIVCMYVSDLLQVVADVDEYKHFVPWCVGSEVFEKRDGHAKAALKIGIYPHISPGILVSTCVYLCFNFPA